MNILVTNDDGIEAEGIEKLVELAKNFGRVTVVAPLVQCSAMSQKLTIGTFVDVKEIPFKIPEVTAYSVKGTPADCVKLAVKMLLKEKPDMLFSGINRGYNTGYDICYSATVGACMEALLAGIPAIAFSSDFKTINFETVDSFGVSVVEQILKKTISRNQIWNVNFPACPALECKGILWDRVPEQADFYDNLYTPESLPDGSIRYHISPEPINYSTPGTDISALKEKYISVGKLSSMVVRSDDE